MALEFGTVKWGIGDGTLVNREDLLDIVTQQTPSDTPWLAQAPKGEGSAILHQWLTDTMRAPRVTGHIEGAAYSFMTSTTPARNTNLMMIFREDIGVSRSQMKVNPAGIGNTYSYEMEKATKQIGTDIETAVFSNLTSATGTTGAARVMKGFYNFITSNSAYPASLGTSAVAGQLQASDFNNLLETIYSAGGNPDQVFASPRIKRMLGALTLATQTRNVAAAEKKLYGGIEMYDSDWGLLAIVVDRFVPQGVNTTTAASAASDVAGTLYVLERAKNRWDWLDPVHHEYVGKLGDSINGIVVGEGTLVCLNQKANGKITSINNKQTLLGD